MKLIKILGFSAVTALAVLAFSGVSMATSPSTKGVLCKVHPKKVVEGEVTVDKCPESQVYGKAEKEKQIKLHLKTLSLFKKPGEQGTEQETFISCNESELKGQIEEAQPQVKGKFKEGFFKNNGGKCIVEEPFKSSANVELLNLPWNVKAQYEGQQLGQEEKENVGWGKLEASRQEETKPIKFKISQPFLFSCTYELKEEPLQGKLLNGEKEPNGQQSQVIFEGAPQYQPEFKLQTGTLGCIEQGKYQTKFVVKGERPIEGGGTEQIDIYLAKEQQAGE